MDIGAAVSPRGATSGNKQCTVCVVNADIGRCLQSGKGKGKMVVCAHQPSGAVTNRYCCIAELSGSMGHRPIGHRKFGHTFESRVGAEKMNEPASGDYGASA